MCDREDVERLMQRAKEADWRAKKERDPQERSAWLVVAAFWLNLAERMLSRAEEFSFQTMH